MARAIEPSPEQLKALAERRCQERLDNMAPESLRLLLDKLQGQAEQSDETAMDTAEEVKEANHG